MVPVTAKILEKVLCNQLESSKWHIALIIQYEKSLLTLAELFSR